MEAQTRLWEDDVAIPTYGIGQPNKNPMFLEKRVYQGSSGKVYPYPVIDTICDEKQPQTYHIVCLENEYVHIEIMPEIGGRIYRALDKTNGYDFVYYNRVIKPALVGLTGPWISGGIEFNWPQHHRPNTFGPVGYTTSANEDGSKTVWVSEIDRMAGTKMTAAFTLYPGKAYLEISVQLYNRTPLPQTFLWWANPAVAVNNHTQSVFPPDVQAVYDHGRRAVSRFPIATGTYYKMDYSAGIDISRYKNIPVPTSYMAYRSNYDFMGGYDYSARAGLLHIANHHISPGKKQWTWGNGPFGKAWERNLTDEDGPYIELMAGVYTDNQPDFSWLQPYEEKAFKQYFLPYKHIGAVKNATIDAVVNLEVNFLEQTTVCVQVYTTGLFTDAQIQLKGRQRHYLQETVTLSPTQTFSTVVSLDPGEQAYNLVLSVTDASQRTLVVYQPGEAQEEYVPEPARPLPPPEDLPTTEALYLAGLHLEQYRHATFNPTLYYQEGLRRDPGDIRLNLAYGTRLLRQGLFQEGEKHFRAAIATLTRHNANPYDSEAYYQLGLALQWQGRLDEAYVAFYKATWSAAWQASSYFSLAQIACANQRYAEALDLAQRSLLLNAHNYKARHLLALALRTLGKTRKAQRVLDETLALDCTDFGAHHEQYLLYLSTGEQVRAEKACQHLHRLMRGDVHNTITLAHDYLHCGHYAESAALLLQATTHAEQDVYPMLHYYLGYVYERMGDTRLAARSRQAAEQAAPDYCFPNTLEDLLILESASATEPETARAHYYLGNLLYDKGRHLDAIAHWERTRAADPTFATVQRNLALAYYNTLHDPTLALAALEKAFACDPSDARVLYELDQLYLKIGYTPEKRLTHLESQMCLLAARDDLYLQYITLLNTCGQHDKALMLLRKHIFHPWEGGEGSVARQYSLALVEIGKTALQAKQGEAAEATLQQALVYPDNLGEGKLTGAQQNNISYYLGCAYELQGRLAEARTCFTTASQGLSEPANAMFYNDQPPDMIFYQGLAWRKLGNEQEACNRFHALIQYSEQHLCDTVKIDYFAVSLPDFLVFEDDLQKRNEVHCFYMCGLGHLGLGELVQARAQFAQALERDPNHQGALFHLMPFNRGSEAASQGQTLPGNGSASHR